MDKIYYISQGETANQHLINIQVVLEAGCKLVQLRLKNTPIYEYITIAKKAKLICEKHNAHLLINDSIEVALEVNASGVHLGKNDSSPLKAREILGPNSIIGGTANTFEDCKELYTQNVDYIGLGPFRFTNTKKNLSPVLGIQGYQTILEELKQNNIFIPIYAIGGIEEQDIKKLTATSINGIALSGLLSNKKEIEIKQHIKQISNSFDLATIHH